MPKSHLVSFINLILSKIFENSTASDYFQILARFASLGPQARLYLLKAKIVGRMLEVCDGAEDSTSQFQDMSDLVYEEIETPEIGLPTPLEKALLSYWDEFSMNKGSFGLYRNIDHFFLFETLSWCLKSCKLTPQPSPLAIDEIKYEDLLEEEKEKLVPNHEILLAMYEKSIKNVRSSLYLSESLSYLSFNNELYNHHICETLRKGFEANSLIALRPFFVLFKKWIRVEDSLVSERLEQALNMYCLIL